MLISEDHMMSKLLYCFESILYLARIIMHSRKVENDK